LYTRWNNPTVDAAAQALNELEGGAETILFSSGMAAISTALLSLLQAGDHVVINIKPYYHNI
jgi:cystathionine beta-lyase/cystathionine gamma-synthase